MGSSACSKLSPQIEYPYPESYRFLELSPNQLEHLTQTSRGIHQAQKSGLYCDIFIVFPDKFFTAHLFILAFQSLLFRRIAESWSGTNKILLVKVSHVRSEIFSHLLTFIYTGHLEINKKIVAEISLAAIDFEMDEVFRACVLFASKMDAEQALYILLTENIPETSRLFQIAVSYVTRNYTKVYGHRLFVELPADMLYYLLCNNQLEVSTELQTLDSLLKWTSHRLKQRKANFDVLVKCIHFGNMSTDELVFASSMAWRVQNSEELRELLLEALWNASKCQLEGPEVRVRMIEDEIETKSLKKECCSEAESELEEELEKSDHGSVQNTYSLESEAYVNEEALQSSDSDTRNEDENEDIKRVNNETQEETEHQKEVDYYKEQIIPLSGTFNEIMDAMNLTLGKVETIFSHLEATDVIVVGWTRTVTKHMDDVSYLVENWTNTIGDLIDSTHDFIFRAHDMLVETLDLNDLFMKEMKDYKKITETALESESLQIQNSLRNEERSIVDKEPEIDVEEERVKEIKEEEPPKEDEVSLQTVPGDSQLEAAFMGGSSLPERHISSTTETKYTNIGDCSKSAYLESCTPFDLCSNINDQRLFMDRGIPLKKRWINQYTRQEMEDGFERSTRRAERSGTDLEAIIKPEMDTDDNFRSEKETAYGYVDRGDQYHFDSDDSCSTDSENINMETKISEQFLVATETDPCDQTIDEDLTISGQQELSRVDLPAEETGSSVSVEGELTDDPREESAQIMTGQMPGQNDTESTREIPEEAGEKLPRILSKRDQSNEKPLSESEFIDRQIVLFMLTGGEMTIVNCEIGEMITLDTESVFDELEGQEYTQFTVTDKEMTLENDKMDEMITLDIECITEQSESKECTQPTVYGEERASENGEMLTLDIECIAEQSQGKECTQPTVSSENRTLENNEMPTLDIECIAEQSESKECTQPTVNGECMALENGEKLSLDIECITEKPQGKECTQPTVNDECMTLENGEKLTLDIECITEQSESKECTQPTDYGEERTLENGEMLTLDIECITEKTQGKECTKPMVNGECMTLENGEKLTLDIECVTEKPQGKESTQPTVTSEEMTLENDHKKEIMTLDIGCVDDQPQEDTEISIGLAGQTDPDTSISDDVPETTFTFYRTLYDVALSADDLIDVFVDGFDDTPSGSFEWNIGTFEVA